MNIQEPPKRTKLVSIKFNNLIKYPYEGLCYAFKYELSMLIHIFVAIAIVILGVYLKLSVVEWLVILAVFGLVMGGEMVNTAIEATVDLYTKEICPGARIAKDTASAMVLVFSFTAVGVGLIIFIPKIIELFS